MVMQPIYSYGTRALIIVGNMYLNPCILPTHMTFSRTPALDRLVEEWTTFGENVHVACDEILSCRPDIVLGRDCNAVMGALGEAAMSQYIYHGLEGGQINVPVLEQSPRFMIRYETEPLLAVTISDVYRGIVREYDGLILVGDTVTILECKVIDSISNIVRAPRGRQRKERHSRHMRRNEAKLARIAQRYGTIRNILVDLTGTSDVAMIYFIPQDTYEDARATHGLLQHIEREHQVYVVPFSSGSSVFQRGANHIQQHAKYARWVRKYRQAYPAIYK